MSNKFKAYFWNHIVNPVVPLTASSESAAYPLSNLKDSRLSRPLVFADSADPETITGDYTNVASPFDKAEEFMIKGHNLTTSHTITIKANPTNSWGSPAVTIGPFSVPADPDTDPTLKGETNIISRTYNTFKKRLGQDILSGNNFIRVEIAGGTEAIRIGKMFLGWGMQWNLNFFLDWQQGFNDIGALIESSSVLIHSNGKAVGRTFTLPFNFSGKDDTTYAKYLVSQFGTWRSLWCSLEPEAETNVYAADGIRAHRLTIYGKWRIVSFSEQSAGVFSYALECREDFAEIPIDRAFPEPVSQYYINGGTNAVAATSHTINLPATRPVGSLCIVDVTFDGLVTSSGNFPAGWANIVNSRSDDYGGGGPFDACTMVTGVRVLDGSEGSTITVTSNAPATSSHVSIAVTEHDYPAVSIPVAENGEPIGGSDDTPDVAGLSMGTNRDWLLIFFCGFGNPFGGNSITSHATGYTDGGQYRTVSSGTGVCLKNVSASSEGAINETLASAAYPWLVHLIAIPV